MEVRYYKQIGTQGQVTSIVQLFKQPNEEGIYGYRYPFSGEEPQALRRFDAVTSVVEVGEKEFNHLMDNWSTIYSLRVESPETVEEFVPKTKYSLIHEAFIIEGYSDKCAVELNKFLQDMRGKCFVMKGEDGNPVAFINQDISYKASYVFEEAVEE